MEAAMNPGLSVEECVRRLKRYVTGGIFLALGATAAAAKRAT